MSVIYYNLSNVQPLGPMVFPPGINPFPHVPAIYVIFNHNNNNAYVGIAGDMHARYAPRAEAVSHLGLENPYIQNIEAWYGNVWVYNTPGVAPAPAAFIGPALHPAAAPMPPGGLVLHGGPPVPIGNVGPYVGTFSNVVITTLGAGTVVNLERILIRAYLNIVGGGGGPPAATTTNTALALVPWVNTTANNVYIYVNYCLSPHAAAGHFWGTVAPGAGL